MSCGHASTRVIRVDHAGPVLVIEQCATCGHAWLAVGDGDWWREELKQRDRNAMVIRSQCGRRFSAPSSEAVLPSPRNAMGQPGTNSAGFSPVRGDSELYLEGS